MISALSTRFSGRETPGLDRCSSGRLKRELRHDAGVFQCLSWERSPRATFHSDTSASLRTKRKLFATRVEKLSRFWCSRSWTGCQSARYLLATYGVFVV